MSLKVKLKSIKNGVCPFMISFLGHCIKNLVVTLKYIFSGQTKFSEIVYKAASISYDSLPIAIIIVSVAAVVIAVQVAQQFLMTGAEGYVGGSLTIALVREIAPGFVAMAISARSGTAICSEMANMQVTSQVDAMKTLKVDPVGYYFAPRLIASVVTVPMVVIIAELLGIIAGMAVCFVTIDLHPNLYFNSVWLWLLPKDLYISLFKAAVFGAIITIVCATQGYITRGGAADVGISTTQSAIKSTIYLLVADFIINLFFYVNI